MRTLFEGAPFSKAMNEHLKKMTEEIAKLPCTKLLAKSAEEFDALAQTFADKYQANDLAALERDKIQKNGNQQNNSHYWDIPFKGNADYFSLSPSTHVLGQYVDDINKNRIRIQVESSRFPSFEQAEQDIEKRLDQIEKTLAQFQSDIESWFSHKVIKESAAYAIAEALKKCQALSRPGYTLT
jgi:DNA repair ATPase RecN